MHKERLIELNRRGLIPGPYEKEESFAKRISSLPPSFPLPSMDRTKKLYDFSADWINVEFSNKGLLPWQGGVTTMEEGKCRLQFREKGIFSYLYTHEEIVAHESVHAARSAFEEPLFEEILAYQTSDYWWRRILGPLLQSNSEGIILVTSFCLLISSSIAMLINPIFLLFYHFSAIATGVIGGGLLLRLALLQWLFFRCKKRLAKLFKNPQKALSTMLLLRDREIIKFAFLSPTRIQAYAKENKDGSLRGLLISLGFESCGGSK